MVPEGALADNHYRILRFIGEGCMSRVYKAEDIRNGSLVAVKFMKEKVTSSYIEDSIRFKKEIEAAGRLDHSGIAKVYEAGEYNGIMFIAMEFLHDESLDRYLKKKTFEDWDEPVHVFHQLVEIVDYVHGNGIIHRNVNPGNFFVRGSEDCVTFKLADLGVAHIMELSEIKDDGEILDTFGYMSPEASGQLNSPVDERSDLYSLGVIFYRLLTGELPFTGNDLGKLLHRQVAATPAAPVAINPSIPPVLCDMAMKLLMKDPDERYQSARGLLNDLDRYMRGERHFSAGVMDRKARLTYRTRMVGRENEMAEIVALREHASHGKGIICLVGGEAGSGKSRLLDEFKGRISKDDVLVIGGRCLNHKNKTPYQPFRDAMNEYIGRFERYDEKTAACETVRLKEACGDLGEILVRLNPGIKKFLGETKELIPLEPERESQRFLSVASDFFCSLAKEGKTCVIVLDDIQWIDDGSMSLLDEIARRIGKSRLLIVAAYRDNEVSGAHPLESFKKKSEKQGFPLKDIKLGKLDRYATGKLVAGMLGDASDELEVLTEYIYEKSEGNPFFMANLLRELVENNIVARKDGGWFMDSEKLRGAFIPDGIVETILNRVGKLDGHQKKMLCRAAIIGREFEVTLLHSLADCDLEKLVEMIDQAISMQFLERTPHKGKLLFAHDRIRDAFFNMLDDKERRNVHKEILIAMERLSGSDSCREAYELAYHAIEAGDEPGILKYAIPAADKAKQSYANEDAVKFYLTALDLFKKTRFDNHSEWIRVNESLIEVFLLIGRNDDAIRMSEDLLPMLETSISKSRVYKKIGIAYFKKGDWGKCEENIAMGLTFLGEKIPVGKTESFVSLVGQLIIHLLLGLIPDKLLGRSKSSLDLEEKKEIVWSYYTLSWAYGLSDIFKFLRCAIRPLNLSVIKLGPSKEFGSSLSMYAALCMTVTLFERGLKYHQRALQVRSELGDKWGEAQTYQFIGYNLNWKGEYAQSAEYFDKSVRMFREIGDLWEEGLSLVGLTGILIYTNRYKEGIDNCLRYLEQSKKMNNIYGVNVAKQSWARILIETGDFDDAEELLKSTVTSSRENGIMILYCVALCYLGFLYLEKNQFAEAVENLVQAKACYLENNFLKDPLLQIFPHLADAYVKKLRERYKNTGIKPPAEEIGKARLLCRDALKKTRRWTSHYEAAIRAAAGFYVLTDKGAKAERLFQKSMDCSRKLGRRYETAKGHLEYGMVLETAGRRREALENFQKAYGLFDDIGAKAYVKRCEAVLTKNEANGIHTDALTARDRLRSERRMKMVLTVGRHISSILDLDGLLGKIMDGVVELVGAERGILLLYPEEGEKKLQAKVMHNMLEGAEHDGRHVARMNIIARVESEKIPLLVSDVGSEEEFKNGSTLSGSVKSVICVPVTAKGETLGVIYLDNNLVNGLFDGEDLDVVSILAGQAGVSIQNAKMYSRLKGYLEEIEKSRDEIADLNKRLEQRVEERTEELNKKNIELASAIAQLKGNAHMVEELAVTRERNRFAMDAHDHLGHTLTLLIKLVEDSRMTCLDSPEKMDFKLAEAARIAREGLDELRSSVKGLASDKIKGNKLIEALEELAEDLSALGTHVELSVSGIQDLLNPLLYNTLYSLCVEASTNALRHGKAKNISIILKKENGRIRLVIFDDGCGCKDFVKGFGLSGMEERVMALNGRLKFNSDGENGFIVRADIPCGEDVKI